MSVVVTVAAAGAVTVGAPVLSALAAAAAAALGMRVLDAAEQEQHRVDLQARRAAQLTDLDTSVELSVATEAVVDQVVADRCVVEMADDRVLLRMERDIRGALRVTAHGEGVSRAEVSRRAEALLGLLRQQIAYRDLVRRMEGHGFAVAEEQRAADGTVRLRLRRGP
jgi:hypothetical protein